MEAQAIQGLIISAISVHDPSVKERILVNLLLAHPPTPITDGRPWDQTSLDSAAFGFIHVHPDIWGISTLLGTLNSCLRPKP